MGFLYDEKYQYLTSICLNVTNACNLKCKYCFVHQQQHFMELQVAKDIVDWLEKNLNIKKEKNMCNENEKISITFFGGEPMLMYDTIIIPLTQYLKDTYPNTYNLSITTNGTLLDNDKISWFKDNNFSLLLSIDGAETTQNYNRSCHDETKKSFDLVNKNIPILLAYYPNITFRSTIDQDTAHLLFENYLFAEINGFKNIFMVPNSRERWTEEHLNNLSQEVDKIFAYLQNKFLNNENIMNCEPINEAFKQVKNNIKNINNSIQTNRDTLKAIDRCGLGTTSGSIDYQGNIYGCQEQDSYATKESIFYLGNVYQNGIEIERHIKLLKDFQFQGVPKCENRELCFSCLFKNLCNDCGCPSVSNDCFKDFSIIGESKCTWSNLLFFNALKLTFYLYSQNNQYFINYFNNL